MIRKYVGSMRLHGLLLWFAGVFALNHAFAAVPSTAFGREFVAPEGVNGRMAQVVYYRGGAQSSASGGANVYIDGEFHASLLPNGFTVFCLAAGAHDLVAVQNDAPHYAGKDMAQGAMFNGGQTYFYRYDEAQGATPVEVVRAEAERQLLAARAQVHLVSRASSVVDCRHDALPQGHVFTLSGDVLFSFDKHAYADMHDEGRKAIADIAHQLRDDRVTLDHVEVIGHADSIGDDASNDRLGLLRAQTVRQVLIDSGVAPSLVSAQSRGSREPLLAHCSGNLQERIACNAPNRRVVIEVNGRR